MSLPVVKFCYALSLLCRRTLIETSASYNINDIDSFLYGYNTLFRGDVRISAIADDWALGDLEILVCAASLPPSSSSSSFSDTHPHFQTIVTSAIRMSLRLQQDDFSMPGEYEDINTLYDAIKEAQAAVVICHEGDPLWKKSILEDRPSLVSIRKTKSERNEQPEYQVLTLNLRFAKFKVVKLNKESVRSMWAAQQQELIFYGNQNEERGSIQQMKSVLRNLITQSCDLPVGYPIYISPLTTSYATRPTQARFSTWASKHLTLPERRRPVNLPSIKGNKKKGKQKEQAVEMQPAADKAAVATSGATPDVASNTGAAGSTPVVAADDDVPEEQTI